MRDRLFAVLISLIVVGICFFAISCMEAQPGQPGQPPGMPVSGLDPEGTITIRVIPGVRASIIAPSERVTLQHDKANTIIFIDTRPAALKRP